MTHKNNLENLVKDLVCPSTGGKLILSDDHMWLISPIAKIKYPIKNDIPIMVVQEATSLSHDELEALTSVS
ncbi:MAG: Trm112 family protein [Pseudomonadota bacterium]